MYEKVNKVVLKFHDNFTEKVEKMTKTHGNDVATLAHLRKNYQRLVVRTGIEKESISKALQNKTRKDIYKIHKENRKKKYEFMMKYDDF